MTVKKTAAEMPVNTASSAADVKSKTWEHDIWEFMNSATLKADISNLEVSEISKTTDVNSAATSIAKLKNIEKNIYQVLLAQYNHKIFAYD